MRNNPHFKTDVDCGFNLPSAFNSRSHQRDYLIAITLLITSVFVAAFTGALMIIG